jgi:pimeloyl-ACP methyl ester carboxylesterase
MQVPFAAHSSMEILRWLVRSTPRVDGQRYLTALRTPIEVPVLEMHGEADRCLPPLVTPPGTAPRSRLLTIPDAGHFLPEEAPDQVNDALLEWLRGLD